MCSGHSPAVRARCLVLAAGLALGSLPFAWAGGELGRPVIRAFAPGEHLRGLSQPRITQDATGLTVHANDGNLLLFDGVRWHVRELSPESAGVRQFATAADGMLYLAGAGVLGYLTGPGLAGEFVSLADRLPAGARNIDDLRCAVAAGRSVYFADDEKILVWRDGRFGVIPFPTPPGSWGARLHGLGGEIYVSAPGRGLLRLADDRAELVSADPVLRENRLVSLEAGKGGAMIFLTAERGFFQLGADGRVAPYATEINRWIAGRRVFCAVRLPDGSRAVGFSAVSGDGGMRFDPAGRYVGPLDTTIGLIVKTVRDFHRDEEGGLWLGMDTGAARLEWPSPLTLFDGVNGLGRGAVADVARQDGVLYAATNEGLFRLVPDDGAGRVARFERLKTRDFFALAPHPGGLLALGGGELFLLGPGGLEPLLRLPPGGGGLLRSRQDPERVWIGTAHGLRSVRHTLAGWNDEGLVPGFDGACRALGEAADGALWVSTHDGGLHRLTFEIGRRSPLAVESMAGTSGWPKGGRRVEFTEVTGDLAFVISPDQVLRHYDARARRLAPVLWAPNLSAEQVAGWQAMTIGADGTRWLASDGGIERLAEGAVAARKLPHFVGATLGAVANLRVEAGAEGTVLWICGARGLGRVELAGDFPPRPSLTTQLSATNVRDGERLEPEHAVLSFSYVAARQQPTSGVVYQTRLVGHERAWSEWSERRERSFAALPAGHFRFEVRARDADGVVSEPATLSFSVRSPWWETWWAILGYVATGSGLIAGVVYWRTRALQRRAARLEATVAERTRELALKNDELVRLHRLELDEKISARLAEEKARLEVLRYQLNPHFLFNTLASISATLPAGPSLARRMVERLAEFCRLTLHRPDDRDDTTLGEELRLLRAYFEIEQSRWGDLLDVTIDCDPALAGEPLPHFLLLPLVENALKYGRATSPDRVGVRLTAHRDTGKALVLEVANTGEWIPPAEGKTVPSLGIGLDNLRERLARHYPRTHELTISHADGWVRVTLRLFADGLQTTRPRS